MTSSTPPFDMLVFSKAAGYRHESIPAGVKALKRFAASTGHITCHATEDASAINPENLARYKVLVFLHTSGDFLGEAQLTALKGHIRGRGGFVGIHGASAGMPGDEWYEKLVGAGVSITTCFTQIVTGYSRELISDLTRCSAFTYHPKPQDGVIKVETPEQILTEGFPTEWKWHDEWYNFRRNPRGSVEVLLSIDEKCYEGGSMGSDHPLAWCQEFEGGRSFYTALGHFSDAWDDAEFYSHVRRGIYWAADVF